MIDMLYILLLVEWVLLLYVLTLWGEFVFDDLLILENVRRVWRQRTEMGWRDFLRWMARNGRALLWWTFRRDALAHGMAHPCGWHALNIALHAINSVLMFAILRWWFSEHVAFVGALVFASHPIATASVSNVAGRSSVLCSVFVLGAIVAFFCGAWWLIPLLAFCGLRSKEEIVSVVPSLVAVWWWQ